MKNISGIISMIMLVLFITAMVQRDILFTVVFGVQTIFNLNLFIWQDILSKLKKEDLKR